MQIRSLLLPTLVACALTASVSAQCLSTLYARNNGGSFGGAVYFDVNVTNTNGITITNIDTNTTETVAMTLDVYTVPNTRVGNENNMAAWTLVSSGSGIGQGADNPTPVDVADFMLAPGQYGMALVMGATSGHDYTNGNGTNQVYTNGDLTITAGAATNVPFTGNIFDPRVWNGTLYYTTPGGFPCASIGTFGTGCGTPPLTLTHTGTPAFGATVTINTTNIPTGTPIGALALGLLEINPPISLPSTTGCFQYTTVDAALLWIPTGTTATNMVTVPNNTALSGLKITGQSVNFNATLNPLGVITSNGLTMIIGS